MAKRGGWSSADWYKEGEGQLHFFPRQKRMVWTVGQRVVAEAEAWGGERPLRGVRYRTMKPRPTTPGNYVVHSFAPYRTETWPMSRIRWGTPLQVDRANERLLFETGSAARKWRRVDLLIPNLKLEDVQERFWTLYGEDSKYDRDRDGIPEVWVFNDFGPWAVRYYLDPNRNRQFDPGEKLSGEMIHTTPDTEAAAERELPVRLSPSHGCIHIKPSDRERFWQLGAFEVGNLVVVHGPSEVVPELLAK